MEKDVLFSGGIWGTEHSFILVNTQEQSSISPLLASCNASIRSEYSDAFGLNVHIYIFKLY